VFWLPQCVPYPPPFSPFQFFLNWGLVGFLLELFVGNLLRPSEKPFSYMEQKPGKLLKVSYTNSKYSLTNVSGTSSTSDGLRRFPTKNSSKKP
jgi:hypothetical protein